MFFLLQTLNENDASLQKLLIGNQNCDKENDDNTDDADRDARLAKCRQISIFAMPVAFTGK